MTDNRDVISFAEKVLALLDRGSFATTYKHAVLLALMDVCLEFSGPRGDPPASINTRQLSEKILELYWPQALPYSAMNQTVILRQGSSGQSEIITSILTFKRRALAVPTTSLPRARYEAREQLEKLIDTIEWKLVEMPLPRLQYVGSVHDPFIYRIGWTSKVRLSEFRDKRFDRNIYFVHGATKYLTQLSGLIRPLVQREWAARIARYNRQVLEDAYLEEFLFGQQRISSTLIRNPLAEMQGGKCFYCQKGLSTKPDVDHFLPWSRYPNNTIENLVASHRACNSRKGDHLAAAQHLERWQNRLEGSSADELGDVARETRWMSDRSRTASAVRAIYAGLPEDAILWVQEREFSQVRQQHKLLSELLAKI